MEGTMKISRALTLFSAVFLLAMFGGPSVFAQTGTLTIGCPIEFDPPSQDTVIDIPIYATNDVDLGGFSLGFHYNSDLVEIDSVNAWGSVIPTTIPIPGFPPILNVVAYPADNLFLVGWYDSDFQHPIIPQTDGYWFTLKMSVKAGIGSSCIDLDSSFVPPAGDFIFSPSTGGQITPDFVNCDGQTINIGGGCSGPQEVPPVAECQAVTVAADGNCQADASIDNGSYDPEGQDITLTQEPPGPYPLGETTVMLIVTDTDLLADTCEATVTVEDQTPPALTCPEDITVANDAGVCGAAVDFEATASDNCSTPIVTYSTDPGSVFPVGMTAVMAIATDDAGNADTCSFNVTVNDTEAPVVVCPDDIFLDNDPGVCGATATFEATASDNCAVDALTYSQDSGTFFDAGSTMVEVIAADAAGNADTCDFYVVVSDVEAPNANCPDDIVVGNDTDECGAVVNFDLAPTDNCEGVTAVADPASGSMFPLGMTAVTVIATDASGNADTCGFNVTVEDTEPPMAMCNGDTTILVEAGTNEVVVEYSSGVFDNCEGATVSCNPPSGSIFQLGVTEVTCIAVDAAGNEDTCAFNVNVTQQLNPDFAVSVTPDTLYATAGIATPLSYTVDVTSIDGFVDPVTLSHSSLPPEVTLDFSVNPVTPTGSSELSGTTGVGTPAGTYILIVSGLVAPPKIAASHADTVFLKVEACSDTPVVGLSDDYFEFTVTEGEEADSLLEYITNEAACGTLDWVAFADMGWIELVPDNGSVQAGETPGDLMVIYPHTAGLSVGDHQANITVSPVSKAVSSGITVLVHVEAAPESQDTVYVANETGYPGQKVAVDITFKNDEMLAGMSIGLMWTSSDLYLDSVSYVGSRVADISGKVTTIDNANQRVGLGVLVVPPAMQVPVGSGLWGTLFFSVDPSATPGVVIIDTTFIEPGVELVFNDSMATTIYPQFVPGSVTIEEAAPLAGFVRDEYGDPIGGAGVELYDIMPSPGGPIATTVSNPDGSFLFDLTYLSGKHHDLNTATFAPDFYVRAYKDGYYPGVTETPFPNSDVLVTLKANGGIVTPTPEWVSLYCDMSYFDDMPLPLGTVIEAYDPRGNVCGRWEVSEVGRYGFMPVYANDPYSGNDIGLLPGEEITLMVNGYNVDPLGGPLFWGENGDRYEACFDGHSIIEVCIPLHMGWNLISWNVDTEVDDIETLAASVMDNVDVILSFESVGLTYDPLLPEFSTLHYMDHFHGAWFRMNAPDTLCVEGLYVDPSTPIALEQNWNLVSYLPNEVMTVEDALNSIWSYIVVVLGFDGGGLVYDMAHPELSTLHDMAPTFGYWIKMTQSADLIYPGDVIFLNSAPADATLTKNSQIPEVATSNTWINLYGSGVTVDNKPLAVGSIIQAYTDNDVLVGEFAVKEQGKFGFMPVYGLDNYATDAAGAGSGETIHLTVNGIEAEETVNWTANGDRVKVNHFSLNATSANGDNGLPRDYTLSQNYPNPFNPETQIDYYLPNAGMVEVSIYNVLGTKIKTLVNQYQAAGSYSVSWYGDTDTGDKAASGVYFYKLTSGDFSDTRKMMLLK
jgi:hypothetical protein